MQAFLKDFLPFSLDFLPDGMTGLIETGGPVIAILLVLSVLATAVFLIKLIHFWDLCVGRYRRVDQAAALWQDGKAKEAYIVATTSRGSLARLSRHAIRGLAADKPDISVVREDLERVAGDELGAMRRYLRILEVTGQVAPLLGLFGTVLGMIEAFRDLQGAGAQADPATLAGGIWVALLTTAVGLAIAIPASLAYHWFESRLDRERRKMESVLTGYLTGRITDKLPDSLNK